MTRPARSLYIFGIYIFIVGAAFIIAPGPIYTLMRLPTATVGWMRVIGLLTLVIASYDMIGSRSECMPYIRASVWLRFGFAGGTAILVITQQMPATVLAFGATDIAGALWTQAAILSKSPSTA